MEQRGLVELGVVFMKRTNPDFRRHFFALCSSLLLCSALAIRGQAADAEPASKSNETAKPKLTQEELEAAFKATLTKATLSGRWCSVLPDGKKSEGRLKLGPEKEDKYTIIGVSKLQG